MQLHYWQPPIPDRYTAMSPDALNLAIEARRRELGSDLIILGHHYQTDVVVRHADFTGDSLKLSQLAAERVEATGARFVIFCGVHFMAESADLLTPDGTEVILPDLSAGCSMADMASYDDALDAWDSIHETLAAQGWRGRVIPVTYINSSAAIKAFVGANGGVCCTSSNAPSVFDWAMRGGTQPDSGDDIKVLFLPDQHLGRNTAAAYGIDVGAGTCVYDPRLASKGDALGGSTPEQIRDSRVILWAGHCSVHKLFRPEHCDEIRDESPETKILVHPECAKEVVDRADLAGSTEFIIRTIRDAEPGSSWAIGTEVHLVTRIAAEAAERGVSVRMLSGCQCLCTTMYRIDEPHLLWTLDHLVAGRTVNRVEVHPEARSDALVALERMLSMKAVDGIAAGAR
ncbi:MAG: quinolinate synthase NadA [Phycisphaerales bacterium]